MGAKKIWAILAGLFSLVYILNPTFGFFEFLPDNIPGFGNLDEAGAAFILIWAIKQLFGKGGDSTPPGQKPPEKTVN